MCVPRSRNVNFIIASLLGLVVAVDARFGFLFALLFFIVFARVRARTLVLDLFRSLLSCFGLLPALIIMFHLLFRLHIFHIVTLCACKRERESSQFTIVISILFRFVYSDIAWQMIMQEYFVEL